MAQMVGHFARIKTWIVICLLKNHKNKTVTFRLFAFSTYSFTAYIMISHFSVHKQSHKSTNQSINTFNLPLFAFAYYIVCVYSWHFLIGNIFGVVRLLWRSLGAGKKSRFYFLCFCLNRNTTPKCEQWIKCQAAMVFFAWKYIATTRSLQIAFTSCESQHNGYCILVPGTFAFHHLSTFTEMRSTHFISRKNSGQFCVLHRSVTFTVMICARRKSFS